MMRALLRLLPAGGLARNTLFAMGQTVIGAACLFLVYRLVIAAIGIDRFGVWSLLLATSSMARLADVSGGGQAILRYVAIEHSAGRHDGSRVIIHTVLLTGLALNLAIGLAFLLLGPVVMRHVLEPAYVAEGVALVPYAAALLVAGAVAATLLSAIDGTRRTDCRALVGMAGAAALLLAAWQMVPALGAQGFGLALLVQQLFIILGAWTVLRRLVPGLGWLPLSWSRRTFRRTTGFALKSNAIGVMNLLFDPLAKFAINGVGGPGLLGYYELAMRIVVQIRMLALSAANPLVVAFASAGQGDRPAFAMLTTRVLRGAVLAGIACALASLAAGPVVSLAVLGRLDLYMLLVVCALAAGWSINIISAPLYLAAVGQGIMRWNFASHAVSAVTVVLGALLPSSSFGSAAVVLAVTLGLLLGAGVVILGNGRALGVAEECRRLAPQILGGALLIALTCAAMAALLMAGGT